jgi:hypothetical protein
MAITVPLPVTTGQREANQKPGGTAARRVGVSATLAANEALRVLGAARPADRGE